MNPTRIAPVTLCVLALAACSGSPSAPVTITQTVAASPSTTPTDAVTSTTVPTSEPVTPASATTSTPASATTSTTANPTPIYDTPTDTPTGGAAGDPGEAGVGIHKFGDSSVVVPGVTLTVSLGDYKADETSLGKKGCQVITYAAKNNTGRDFYAAVNASDATAASPNVWEHYYIGDELEETIYYDNGANDPNDLAHWPHRIRAGKTARWKVCVYTRTSGPLQVRVDLHRSFTDAAPIGVWERQ